MSVVLQKPPPPRAPVALRPGRRPSPRAEPETNLTAAWTFVGALLFYKVVTIGLIISWTSGSLNSALPLIVAMNWIWVVPLAILLSVIPFAFWFRLVRARAKRRSLLRAEWELD